MEPTPPNPQNPNQQNTNYQNPNTQIPNTDLELRSYFLQQGQSINKLYANLKSNLFAHGFKSFLSVLLQILCYLLFICCIYIAIILPTDLHGMYRMANGYTEVNVSLQDNRITELMMGIKIVIAVISLPVLACAFLLGKNRRKSARLRNAFTEVELMKQNFDQAVGRFRF